MHGYYRNTINYLLVICTPSLTTRDEIDHKEYVQCTEQLISCQVALYICIYLFMDVLNTNVLLLLGVYMSECLCAMPLEAVDAHLLSATQCMCISKAKVNRSIFRLSKQNIQQRFSALRMGPGWPIKSKLVFSGLSGTWSTCRFSPL